MGQGKGETRAKWAGGDWETRAATSDSGSSGDLQDRAALRVGPLGYTEGEYREGEPTACSQAGTRGGQESVRRRRRERWQGSLNSKGVW